MLDKKTLGLVCLATIVGLGVRVFRLDYPALWMDEFTTYFFTLESWGRLTGELRAIDVHPPYYYMVQKLWGGDSVFEMRLLSVLLGTVCIPMVYLLARRLLDKRVGLIAAFLLTTVPLHVYYSRELRMYSLLNFSILVACVGLVYAIDFNGSRYRWGWIIYVLGSISAFYAHTTAIVFPALCAFYIAYLFSTQRIDRSVVFEAFVANFLVLLSVLPWLSVLMAHTSNTLSDFWIHETTISWAVSQILGVYPYPKVIKILFFSAMVCGVWLLREKLKELSFILALVVGQPLLIWIISLAKPIMIVRAMEWPVMIAVILPAVVISRVQTPAAILLTTLFILVQVPAISHLYPNEPVQLQAAGLIPLMREIEETDVLLLEHQRFEKSFRFLEPHLFDNGNAIALRIGNHPSVLNDVMKTRFIYIEDLEYETRGKRIWVVSESNPKYKNEIAPVVGALMAARPQLKQFEYQGYVLTLLDAY